MYIMLAIKIHLHKQTIHWATLFIELRRLFLLSIPPGRQMRTQNSLLMSDCSNLELFIWSNISECWVGIERPTSTLTSAWKSNLVRDLVTGAGWLCPNFFDTKLTRLAHLLSFASLLLVLFLVPFPIIEDFHKDWVWMVQVVSNQLKFGQKSRHVHFL